MHHPQKAGKTVVQEIPWWETEREGLLGIAATHTPCYVYNSTIQIARAKQLLALEAIDNLFYAIKANPHPTILKTLEQEGIGFECVSMQELTRVLELFPNLDRT